MTARKPLVNVAGLTQELPASDTVSGSITGNAATVTTNANLTGPITSSGNATAVASQTGTGTKFVMDTSPALVTPDIGAATGTSLNLTGGVLTRGTTENALTAHAGGGQASALALSATSTYHRISTVATAGDSVRLPTSVAGQEHFLKNDGVASMQVYGASTDTVNGVATATGVPQAPGVGAWYVCTVAGNWLTSDNDRTGTGKVVRDTSPTLVTPTLGVATATTINKVTITQPATGSTITIPDGVTVTGPAATDTLVGRASTDTLTNKRITARVGSTTSSATPTINTDNVDVYKLTAQTADITSFTTNLTGTPADNDVLIIEITGTAARAITWGSSFEASTVALPTTTVSTAMLAVGFLWNTATSKWRCVAAV